MGSKSGSGTRFSARKITEFSLYPPRVHFVVVSLLQVLLLDYWIQWRWQVTQRAKFSEGLIKQISCPKCVRVPWLTTKPIEKYRMKVGLSRINSRWFVFIVAMINN